MGLTSSVHPADDCTAIQPACHAVYRINDEQAIVGMPVNTLPHAAIREILRGGEAIKALAETGIAT